MMKFRDTNLKRALKNIFYLRRRDIVVLEPHLGLGDNIICLGLVRAMARNNPNKKFYYVCLHRCYQSLAWMFQDLSNVFLFAVESGREARQLAGFLNAEYLPIGIVGVDLMQFDRYFYDQHQVNFELRWLDSSVPPGPKSEDLFRRLNPMGEPYILVCDSKSENNIYGLNIENPRNLKVIKIYAATDNIYDWTKLVLFADEIHTIDTSFIHFVESTLYGKPVKSIFYHVIRKDPSEFSRKLPWISVEYPD